MAAYFRPTLKDSPTLETKEQFLEIDLRLCKMLGIEPHPLHWTHGWVDGIGFCFAMGDTPDKIKANFDTDEWGTDRAYANNCKRIVDWLVEHCEINCYHAR